MGKHETQLCFRCGVALAGRRAFDVRISHRNGRCRRAWVCSDCELTLTRIGQGTVIVDGSVYMYELTKARKGTLQCAPQPTAD